MKTCEYQDLSNEQIDSRIAHLTGWVSWDCNGEFNLYCVHYWRSKELMESGVDAQMIGYQYTPSSCLNKIREIIMEVCDTELKQQHYATVLKSILPNATEFDVMNADARTKSIGFLIMLEKK